MLCGGHFPVKDMWAWPSPDRLWSLPAFTSKQHPQLYLAKTTRLTKAVTTDEDEVRLAPRKWGPSD